MVASGLKHYPTAHPTGLEAGDSLSGHYFTGNPMESNAEASPQPKHEHALHLHTKHPVSFWGSLQCNLTGCHIVKHVKEQITNNEELRH